MPGARSNKTPITVENPNHVGRAPELGDFTVTFETIRGGIDPAPFFKGLPDDRCPCSHWGPVVSGRITVRYADHEETFEAGDAFFMSPGHPPLSTPGTELITFSPIAEIKEVNAALARNLQAMKP